MTWRQYRNFLKALLDDPQEQELTSMTYGPTSFQESQVIAWLNAHDTKFERRLSRLERAQDPPETAEMLQMAINEVGAVALRGVPDALPASRVPILYDLLIELQGRLTTETDPS